MARLKTVDPVWVSPASIQGEKDRVFGSDAKRLRELMEALRTIERTALHLIAEHNRQFRIMGYIGQEESKS